MLSGFQTHSSWLQQGRNSIVPPRVRLLFTDTRCPEGPEGGLLLSPWKKHSSLET